MKLSPKVAIRVWSNETLDEFARRGCSRDVARGVNRGAL
jgi:hypothetical protein